MSLFNGRYISPLKNDGTQNIGGKVYFYESGTSTLKAVYTDESITTAHTNPVILDSAGSALIFLGSGSYDYKVDDSDDAAVVTLQGPVSSKDTSGTFVITTTTLWTIDGAGLTDTTFVDLETALDESRNYTLISPGSLEIKYDNGSFTESSLDFNHPQGNLLSISGSGSTYLYVADGTTNPIINISDGFVINTIENLYIYTDLNNSAMNSVVQVDDGGMILNLDISIRGLYLGNGAIPFKGVYVKTGGYINLSGSLAIASTQAGLYVESGGVVVGTSFTYFNQNESFTADEGLHVRESGRVELNTFSCYGSSSFSVTYAARAENGAYIVIDTSPHVEYANTGYFADDNSTITINTAPTFGFGVSTQYNPAKNTISSVTAGSADLSLIKAP